jgi:hypothetical protein
MEDPVVLLQGAFIALLAATAWFQRLSLKRRLNTTALAAIAMGVIVLARWSGRWVNPAASSVLEDWLPALLMLFPYWQIGQFFMKADPVAEKRLAMFDHAFFRALGIAPAKTPISRAAGVYLELCYLLVYPLIPLGLAALYLTNATRFVNYYWVVVLLATYICFAITPFVRAMPPRALASYEKFRMPPCKVRAVNRLILRRCSIQAITFPSAHVASAMAAGLVLLRIEPGTGLIFMLIGVSIAIATVVGGYHYAADALLASLIAIMVFAATFHTLRAG